MSAWRVVLTDSERLTGVAPVCPKTGGETSGNHVVVHDCCPGPHIECWSEHVAAEVVRLLTTVDAEICA